MGISPLDKPMFLKLINNVLTGSVVSDKQEYCNLVDLNININLLLDKKETFNNETYGRSGLNLPYLDFYFCFSLEQLISVFTRVTNKTSTRSNHALINSSQKVVMSGHDPISYSRK